MAVTLFAAVGRIKRSTLTLPFVVLLLCSAAPAAASPCGGGGQRACCNGAGEFSNAGSACNCYAVIASGCDAQTYGDCDCSGSLFTTSDHCNAVSCGGDGQRACCATDNNCAQPCKSGLTEVNGCSDCGCSNSHCKQATHCGAEGERACCGGELIDSINACGSGLAEVDGCTGDCFCGGSANPFAINSSGHCVAVTPCGEAGQRACCNGAFEFAPNGLACDTGFVQISGCDDTTSNCYCSDGISKSAGTCVQPTHCGSKGERACCNANGEYAAGTTDIVGIGKSCESGLVAIPGCSGDCTCGGTLLSGLVSVDTCTQTPLETIAEPSIGFTATTPLPSDPLRGYADLHVHMFAHLAHGGVTVAGTPYDATGGVNTALREDYGTSQHVVDKKGADATLDDDACKAYLNGLGSSKDASINDSVCSGDPYLLHGGHGLSTLTGGGTNDAAGSNFGAPVFNGWPQANSTIHQQVYYKWLERAWRGGLRLITMFAVTNKALCLSSSQLQGTNCTDSMASIDAQLQAAWDFQSWLDTQPGGGWFRIVTSPQQAAAEIRKGNLAVVLGIEVENLFNCHVDPTLNPAGATCDDDYVKAQVQWYYDHWGVRHIFPVHNFDNAYGSPAAWQDPINAGNRAAEGQWWPTEDCANNPNNEVGYGFWLEPSIESVALFLGFNVTDVPLYYCGLNADGSSADLLPTGCLTSTAGYASCHKQGMRSLGTTLVTALMDRGMIVDVDHLSTRSLDDVLTMAEARTYAGIVASHVQFFDLYTQQYNPPNTGNYGRHERMRTAAQLTRIKNLGGMIAVMLKDDVQDTGNGYCASRLGLNTTLCDAPVLAAGPQEGGKFTVEYGGYNNNCRYSTTEWYEAYRYGVDQMGGPVAMGSDFNGIAGHVGPRFGSTACGGSGVERSAQEKTGNRLGYPFTLDGFGSFDKQVSGERSFDFNSDGLAHIGLLPDMVADLKNVDPSADLEPLFHSASAFIDMWSAAYVPIATQFVVSATTPETAGTSFQITVTAEDSEGNTAKTYAGTVQFTSSDGLAALPANSTLTNGAGTFTVTLNTGGTQTITATDTASSSITGTSNSITVNQSPAITSANKTTFKVGTAGSFAVTATGFPVSMTFTKTGALPSGVTLSSGGGLSGTPAAGTGGTYPITIKASNGISPDATQSFTLTVDQPPAITSANHTTFTTGTAGSFTVTATGFPTSMTFTKTGALPSGVTLSSSGGLSGTPAAGTGGTYPITIKASNGVSPDATQSFTLTVDQPPAITSANHTTFTTGTAGSFTVTATGFPTSMTFTKTGTLPSGVTLSSSGGLSGTPAAGTGGTYPITIKASNGISPDATQSFTLTVDQAPAITSANNTTFTVGTAGSFPVTATGFPTAMTFSETGALPSGVHLSSSGGLSGTPAAGTGGTYPITIKASNGVSPDATQSFTLNAADFTITASPPTQTIMAGHSAVHTITVTSLGGLAGKVTLTCSGNPATSYCTISPNSVTLNGTTQATIKFVPAGTYHGTSTLTFRGTLGSLTHGTNVGLTVK